MTGIPVVFVSALEGRGRIAVLRQVVQTYEKWCLRLPTAQINRWLRKVCSVTYLLSLLRRGWQFVCGSTWNKFWYLPCSWFRSKAWARLHFSVQFICYTILILWLSVKPLVASALAGLRSGSHFLKYTLVLTLVGYQELKSFSFPRSIWVKVWFG